MRHDNNAKIQIFKKFHVSREMCWIYKIRSTKEISNPHLERTVKKKSFLKFLICGQNTNFTKNNQKTLKQQQTIPSIISSQCVDFARANIPCKYRKKSHVGNQ